MSVESDNLEAEIEELLNQYTSKDYEEIFERAKTGSLDALIQKLIDDENENNDDYENGEKISSSSSDEQQDYDEDSVEEIDKKSVSADDLLKIKELLNQYESENISSDECDEEFCHICKKKRNTLKESQIKKTDLGIQHKDSILVILEKALCRSVEGNEPSVGSASTVFSNEPYHSYEHLFRDVKERINLLKSSGHEVYLPSVELHLSNSDDEEGANLKLEKFKQQSEVRSKFRYYLSEIYKKLIKHKTEEEVKKKSVLKLLGEELNNFKKKIDIIKNIRIDSRPIDLPSLGNLVFPLTPYVHNNPTECYEAFSTGSLYLGTANLFGMNGHGTYIFPNGATYQGQFKDNMFHGIGRIVYPNKSLVEGIWYNGKLLEPKVYFNDGMYYDPDNWDYLQFPDRRYISEKYRGLLPDNDPQLTDEHPARPLPQGCYDTGEGFYSIKTKCLHNPITGTFIRIPSILEARWIVENCRRSEDNNVPFMSHMFPAQYNVFYPRKELVLDRIWFKKNYPPLDPDFSKTVRSEIVNDLDLLRYCLTHEEMLKYCVPVLQKDPLHIYPDFERHRGKDLMPWVMNVPDSFGLFIISPETVHKLCPGEIKTRTNLQILQHHTVEKLHFNKFVMILHKLEDFIQGKDIVWDEKTEARFLNVLNMFHNLDNAIINSVLVLKKIHKSGKLNKRFIVKALKLWTEDKFPKGTPIQPKHVEVYERKLKQYKKFLIETKLSSTPFTSTDSPTELYPKLEMYAHGNWKMSTINKIKREKYIILANKANRN